MRGVKTLLYAGKSLLKSKIHYLIINIGIIFRYRQSADNILNIILFFIYYNYNILVHNIFNKYDISETEKRRELLSIHVSKHKSLLNLSDNDFGYYLAGLIDSSSFISSSNIIIPFKSKYISLVYTLKKRIGYGNIKDINNTINLVIINKNGLIKIISLINGKLRLDNKINELNILIKDNNLKLNINNNIDNSSLFNNYWLCGYLDCIIFFNIFKIKPELILNIQIHQIYNIILNNIKNIFGGNIIYNEKKKRYEYNCTDVKLIIKYFDKYHLQSSNHVNFLKFRKIYILFLNKKELNEADIKKIEKKKKSMNK